MVSGKGSSQVVMRTLRTMEAHHYSYGLRLTAVPPFERLIDDVRFLCENTSCGQMQVEAAFNTRRGEEGEPDLQRGPGISAGFLCRPESGRRIRPPVEMRRFGCRPDHLDCLWLAL